jgi:hypothetical protein
MVREAELQQTDAGLVPASTGWFVMNARDARWFEKPGQGYSLSLTGVDEYEAETLFPMLGMVAAVPEGRAMGLLLRRRDGGLLQREPARGHAGRERRIRGFPSPQATRYQPALLPE